MMGRSRSARLIVPLFWNAYLPVQRFPFNIFLGRRAYPVVLVQESLNVDLWQDVGKPIPVRKHAPEPASSNCEAEIGRTVQ